MALDKLEKQANKNAKTISNLETRREQSSISAISDRASSRGSQRSKMRRKSALGSDEGAIAGGGIGEAASRGRGRGRGARGRGAGRGRGRGRGSIDGQADKGRAATEISPSPDRNE